MFQRRKWYRVGGVLARALQAVHEAPHMTSSFLKYFNLFRFTLIYLSLLDIFEPLPFVYLQFQLISGYFAAVCLFTAFFSIFLGTAMLFVYLHFFSLILAAVMPFVCLQSTVYICDYFVALQFYFCLLRCRLFIYSSFNTILGFPQRCIDHDQDY